MNTIETLSNLKKLDLVHRLLDEKDWFATQLQWFGYLFLQRNGPKKHSWKVETEPEMGQIVCWVNDKVKIGLELNLNFVNSSGDTIVIKYPTFLQSDVICWLEQPDSCGKYSQDPNDYVYLCNGNKKLSQVLARLKMLLEKYN